MVTIGNVFSVVAALAGICITAWAMILATTLAFPRAAEAARSRHERSAFTGFFIGLGMMVFFGTISLVLLKLPIPLAKLIGTTLYLSLMAIAALGAGGVALTLGARLRTLQPELSPYAALVKADALMVVSCLFPLLGWFLVAPVLTLICLGNGTQALLVRQPARVIV